MMKLKTTALLFVLLITVGLNAVSQTKLPLNEAIKKLNADVPDLMQKADIPGISVALIRSGKLVWTGDFGVMNADTRKPVTAQTVFVAASLSKCVFAYGVLKLVDEGKLDLDVPLNKYLGNDYG